MFMVVRADNRAYGEKACQFLGTKLERQGQGRHAAGRPGLDQRPRPHRGVQRLHEEELPGHQGVRRGDQLGRRDRRRRSCRPGSPRNPDIKGVYMQSSFALAGTLQVLKQKRPAGRRRTTRSTSSSSPTTASPRSSRTSPRATSTPPSPSRPTCTPSTRCTTSRPRSTARRSSPGRPTTTAPSSRSATGLLEDQLSAPLVTRDGGTYGGVPSVKTDDKSLWGNNIS